MTETMSMRRQLLLLTAVLAAFVALGLALANTDDQREGPADARSCAELSEAFEIYSKLISEHDRSWSQWEAVNTEKWATYDAARDKGCAQF